MKPDDYIDAFGLLNDLEILLVIAMLLSVLLPLLVVQTVSFYFIVPPLICTLLHDCIGLNGCCIMLLLVLRLLLNIEKHELYAYFPYKTGAFEKQPMSIAVSL